MKIIFYPAGNELVDEIMRPFMEKMKLQTEIINSFSYVCNKLMYGDETLIFADSGKITMTEMRFLKIMDKESENYLITISHDNNNVHLYEGYSQRKLTLRDIARLFILPESGTSDYQPENEQDKEEKTDYEYSLQIYLGEDFTLRLDKGALFKNNEIVDLSYAEYRMLCLLASSPGNYIPNSSLNDCLGNEAGAKYRSRSVGLCIGELRKKLYKGAISAYKNSYRLNNIIDEA